MSYQYTAVGNVSQVVDSKAGETVNFSYDELNRLTGAIGAYNKSYTYNAAGNITYSDEGGGMYTYDAVKVHQVTSTFIGNSYGYDGAGNMTSRTVGGTSYTLVYDQENRLYTVSGGATATFLYDGDAKRVKGTVGATTTSYVGDYYEWNGSTAKQYYAIGGVRVAMKENTILRYLLSDHLGSTALNVSQALVKDSEVRYYAFGSDRFTSGTMPTTYRYTGQRAEQGIGLYYYNARWYDAALGRFAQADTIVPQPGNPQSLNRYSYVLNNPLRYVDPTGHGEQDYYMFVQGCLSSSSPCDPETAWANYLAYLQNDILKMGDDAFAEWRKTHVRFVAQSNSDPAKLAAAVNGIDAGEGSIFLIGHSAGGSTIVNYLRSLRDSPGAAIRRIGGAFFINAPIGDEDLAQGIAGFAARFEQKTLVATGPHRYEWQNNLEGLGSWARGVGISALTVSYAGDPGNPKQQVGDLDHHLIGPQPNVGERWDLAHRFLMFQGAFLVLSYLTQRGSLY
jgi:RHS repeat-associated protein